MSPYPPDVERTMRAFYHSLRENDRRRYAAVEAAKFGHGGVEYIAKVLGVDPKTIRHGQRDLEDLPDRARAAGPPARRGAETAARSRTRHHHELPRGPPRAAPPAAPPQESLIWTNLTKIEIVDLMQECGSYVSVHIVVNCSTR